MRRTERLKALKVARESTPGMYADGKGLYLQVQAGGNGISKSWLYRYFDPARGRERYMGLGSYPTTSLVDAREKAAEQGRLRERGIDPIAHRDTQRAAQRLANAKAMTFDQCRDAYIASHRSGWRSAKHAGEWLKTLKTYVTPVFGNLPVQSIDVALVTKALEPIWSTKPETAGRIRGRIETVLDWAGARKLRQGENPARWRGHLDKLLPSRKKLRKIKPVKHLAALPYGELDAFMSELHQRPGVSARALEFAILTVARTAEVLGAPMVRGRSAGQGVDDSCRTDEGQPGASCPVIRCRRCRSNAHGEGPAECFRISRRPAGCARSYGAMALSGPHGKIRHHGARLPLDLSGLGGRAHEFSAGGGRSGACPYGRR